MANSAPSRLRILSPARIPPFRLRLFVAMLFSTVLGAAWCPLAALPRDLAAALPDAVARLQERLLTGTEAADLARALATEVGPRLAGSDGDRRAVAWAVEKLRRLEFENVRAEPVTVPRWERGEAEAAIVAPYPQALAVAALGGSVGTPEAGIEAEIVAARDLDALAALDPASVKGRIVYLSQRTERTRDGSGYGKAVSNRSRGAVEAEKLGAVAVLIRSIGTDSSRFPHTGGMRSEFAGEAIPAAALSNADADLVEEMLRGGGAVRVRLRLTCRKLPDATSANVIGEIRGRERPEEIVLLGAHLDSWDLGTGAQDDATGVGLVIAAARAIGELPERPRRTVRVVLFANEEFGLSGAKAYASEHAAELALHQAAIESDLGSGRIYELAARVTPEDAAIAGDLARLVAPLGVEHNRSEAASGGADLSPLRKLGVPVFDLSHDATLYFDIHHTADDTADKIVPGALAQGSAAFASVAWWLADRAPFLARNPLEPETK